MGLKRLLGRTRRLYYRFRVWRDTRQQERMQRFIEYANRPEVVAARRKEEEKEFGRLILGDDGFDPRGRVT